MRKTAKTVKAQKPILAAFDTPNHSKVIIGICLALSFIDMLLLSTALEKLLGFDQMQASLTALILALVGSMTALLWGRAQAQHKARNAWSFPEPWIWIMMGLIFIAIRVLVIFIDIQDAPDDALSIIGAESLSAVMLTLLYVATGLVICTEAKKIFDPSLYIEWRKLDEAKKLQSKIAKKYAEAERLVIELEQFYKYYHAIDKQYAIRKNTLYDAERATLSSVVKLVLEDNSKLDPQVVEEVLQSVLIDRPHVALERATPPAALRRASGN